MQKATLVVRILMGLMLVVFGANKFFSFIPMGEMSAEMGAFMGALMATGYLFTIVAIIEIITGVLFLVNKYTTLASILLFPVMLNAFLAHLFLAPAGIGGAAFILAGNIFIFYTKRDKLSVLLEA